MGKPANVAEYLATLPDPLRGIGQRVREIIDAEIPESGGGTLWHGHPVWSIAGSPTCLIKGYSSYVSFGFWRGRAISDRSGRLQAGARGMAHVKLRSADDIDAEQFAGWLRQARDLERASAT